MGNRHRYFFPLPRLRVSIAGCQGCCMLGSSMLQRAEWSSIVCCRWSSKMMAFPRSTRVMTPHIHQKPVPHLHKLQPWPSHQRPGFEATATRLQLWPSFCHIQLNSDLSSPSKIQRPVEKSMQSRPSAKALEIQRQSARNEQWFESGQRQAKRACGERTTPGASCTDQLLFLQRCLNVSIHRIKRFQDNQ